MTMVLNRIHSVKLVEENKTSVIIDYLHDIKFLDKTTGEDPTNGYGVLVGKISIFRPSTDFFKYVSLKGPEDVIGYAYFTEEDLRKPEVFCWIEIEHNDGFDGNNTVIITGCGDAFKDCPELIQELEKVTGDEYTFTEEVL